MLVPPGWGPRRRPPLLLTLLLPLALHLLGAAPASSAPSPRPRTCYHETVESRRAPGRSVAKVYRRAYARGWPGVNPYSMIGRMLRWSATLLLLALLPGCESTEPAALPEAGNDAVQR